MPVGFVPCPTYTNTLAVLNFNLGLLGILVIFTYNEFTVSNCMLLICFIFMYMSLCTTRCGSSIHLLGDKVYKRILSLRLEISNERKTNQLENSCLMCLLLCLAVFLFSQRFTLHLLAYPDSFLNSLVRWWFL